MATIRKNKNGTFTAEIYIDRAECGKKNREYMTFDGKRECQKAARQREEEIEAEKLGKYDNMKFSTYCDEWLKNNKNLLAATTMKGYKLIIDVHLKPFFGKYKLSKIQDMMIKKYMSEKLDELSSTTVRKHFFTLSKLLGDALKGKNPCVGIKAPKNNNFTPHVPTGEEFNKIYEVFKKISNEDEAIILLAGWCGLRRGEIFAIKWDDIDDVNYTIRIDEAMALEEEGYNFVPGDPKSENGFRTIAVPEYLINLLQDVKEHKPKFKRYKKHGGKIPDIQHFVFQQDPQSFTNKYFDTLEENGLPHIRFHDLRHYHASFLYEHGIPDQYAAQRLGHDIHVLKRVYQHLGLQREKELDAKIKDILK